MRTRQTGLLLLGAASAALSNTAIAQDELTIEEVFVTGQKIERTLQDTKESVAVFDRDFGLKRGLGPRFNGDSCRACHFEPAVGGAGHAQGDEVGG